MAIGWAAETASENLGDLGAACRGAAGFATALSQNITGSHTCMWQTVLQGRRVRQPPLAVNREVLHARGSAPGPLVGMRPSGKAATGGLLCKPRAGREYAGGGVCGQCLPSPAPHSAHPPAMASRRASWVPGAGGRTSSARRPRSAARRTPAPRSSRWARCGHRRAPYWRPPRVPDPRLTPGGSWKPPGSPQPTSRMGCPRRHPRGAPRLSQPCLIVTWYGYPCA